MATVINDLKYSFRMLRKDPAFTAIVLVVLGLGVGANTAIFGVWDKVILRPLPVAKPHELVKVECHMTIDNGKYFDTSGRFRYSDYERFSSQAQLFSGMLAYGGQGKVSLRDQDGMNRQDALAVSGNYFDIFGVKPCVGRMFHAQDDRLSADQSVAVISHAFWRRRFGGRKDVVGQQIAIDNVPVTIIGVAPARFTGKLLGLPEIYLPLSVWAGMNNVSLQDNPENLVHMIGRLKPGVSRVQAEARLRVVASWITEDDPEEIQSTVLLSPANRQKLSGVKQAAYPLPLLMAGSIMLLLIACANIANMQLVRASTRHKEIAIRRAMGASRARIIRQLLCESLLLAVLGGFCGILLATWLDRLLCTFLSSTSFFRFPPGLDARTLTFALAVSLATGVAFGLSPALQITRSSVTPALKAICALAHNPIKGRKLHHRFVIVQVAVSLPVLVFGALCARGLFNLRKEDPGFDPAKVLVVAPDFQGEIHNLGVFSQFIFDLRECVNAVPNVKSASLVGSIPLGESGGVTHVKGIEAPGIPVAKRFRWEFNVVGPEYFQTLGIPLLKGRSFTVHDDFRSTKVILINDVVAQRYWPNQNPIGKRVTLRGGVDQPVEPWEIIGIVATFKLRSIREKPGPIMYLPMAQCPWFKTPDHTLCVPSLLMRAQGDPRALIPGIRSLIKSSPLPIACHVETIADRLHEMFYPQRVITGTLTLLGLIGVLLSACGTYGVLAYVVRQRTREIGIRMALGATKQKVMMPILGKGIRLSAIGLFLGLGLSLCAARVLEVKLPDMREWDRNFLFGVHTWDVMTFVDAALIMTAVALLACYIPARNAAKIDPMEALRYE